MHLLYPKVFGLSIVFYNNYPISFRFYILHKKGVFILYNSSNIVKRINKKCEKRGITQKELLERCGLNKNALNTMTDARGISCFSLCKIAEELDVSIDYLLGRTTDVQVHK